MVPLMDLFHFSVNILLPTELTSSAINPLTGYNSGVFSIFTELYNYYRSPCFDHCHRSKRKRVPFSSYLTSVHPARGKNSSTFCTIDLCFVSIHLPSWTFHIIESYNPRCILYFYFLHLTALAQIQLPRAMKSNFNQREYKGKVDSWQPIGKVAHGEPGGASPHHIGSLIIVWHQSQVQPVTLASLRTNILS